MIDPMLMPLHASERQSNVQGVLFLLLSARASLLRHGADDECLRTMEDCVSSFRLQHNLTDGEVNEGILWEETSIAALLGLLEYAAWRSQRQRCRIGAAPSSSSSASNI